MKRNRKKSSTHEKARPSTSAKLREEHDLAYYVHDRVGLMREVFSILKPKEIKSIYPECVRKLSIDDMEELCLEELLGISSKRLCAILDGATPPSDTDSSSSSESSSSSDSEKSRHSSPAVVEEVICLDSASNDGSVMSNKKKKKKKKKRKRKSTENATSSDATADTQSTEQTQIQQILQTPLNNCTNSAILNKSGAKKQNKNKSSTKAAILDKRGAKPVEPFSERVAKSNEASRAAARAGISVLELLEAQARARAIRAQLRNEDHASQAGPSSTTSANNTTKQEKDSDSEVEIKEAAPEVVDLLSSSDNEEKPRVEELKLEIEVVKEPDPPPNTTKTNDKTKVKRSKTANHNPLKTITTENTTKTVTPLEINNTVTPASKKRKKDKPNIANRVEIVNNKANDSIILIEPKEKLLNSNNKPQIETVVSTVRNESIKQEEDERESSPDLIMLDDSESEKTNDEGNKKLPEHLETTSNNDSCVQSVLKVIDAPRTTKISKTNQKNFTITVSQNDQRKVTKDRNNVVISFSNDANVIDPKRDGNSSIASTQQKHKRDRSSNIIEQSAKKLNSTVIKIIKEKSKGKYLKSVVQKPSDKDRNTRSNRKDKDKKSDDRNKDRYKTKEKDKESDGDEITLQLSDSEKMDLLEDLNPLNLNIVSEDCDHDTKSSDSDNSSSDETEQSDKQTVNTDQVIIEEKFANETDDKRDLNQETTDKNLSSTNEIAGSNYKDFNINETQADNTSITTQNDDAVRDSVANNASNSNLIISEITIPKSIIICQKNELIKPVKDILRNLRVDEMVLDLDTSKKLSIILDNNDLTTNVHNTAKKIAKESNQVSNNTPSESNLTSKNTQSNIDVISKNKDSYPVTNENNLNVTEICSIRDIPILPDYESDSNTQILPEVSVDKDIPQETNSKSRKKKRIKLNRNIRDSSSSDDIVICSDASLSEVKEKKCQKKIEKDGPISESSSQYTECTEQIDDLQCVNTAMNLESRTGSLEDEDKANNPIKEQTLYSINDLQSQKLTNKPNIKTDRLTNENQSHTDEMSETCNYTNTSSSPLETIDDGSETIEGYSRTIDGDGKTIEGIGETKDGVGKTDVVKTSDHSADKIENLVENVEDNKKASDDRLAVIQDGGVIEGIVADTAHSEEKIQSKDVVEQADLEEGEIQDDHKRQVSEEGEITTDTESDIEAQDVQPMTICISDEECTTDNGNSKTIDKNDTKKSKKKNLCKKCKRKKALRKKDDRNLRTVSESKSMERDKVIASDELPRDKVLAIDELPADVVKTNKATVNNDIFEVNKISNDTKAVVIDNISLDSETDSESDSNTNDSSTVKVHSKYIKKDKFEIDKTDKNISNIDLSSPNTQQTDSDTLETLEISDDSSDCYEILSKEPTTEEIEALSEKIDRIDRVEVVTKEEMIQYELSSDSNETSIREIIKSSKNQNEIANIDETHNLSPNSRENSTEMIADENISWRDRYMKSKKVTRVLATSHILNALRKKNLDLKKKMLESKMTKPVEEIKVVVEVVPETVEIGSIEHYNALESSTKYVDPVQEPTVQETEIKDTQLTNEPDVVKTNETETLVNTTTETQIVSKEMKKEAKQLYKMYKKLIKYNNIFKEKDLNKKKKKKKSKKKDGDASCTSVVTENV